MTVIEFEVGQKTDFFYIDFKGLEDVSFTGKRHIIGKMLVEAQDDIFDKSKAIAGVSCQDGYNYSVHIKLNSNAIIALIDVVNDVITKTKNIFNFKTKNNKPVWEEVYETLLAQNKSKELAGNIKEHFQPATSIGFNP